MDPINLLAPVLASSVLIYVHLWLNGMDLIFCPPSSVQFFCRMSPPAETPISNRMGERPKQLSAETPDVTSSSQRPVPAFPLCSLWLKHFAPNQKAQPQRARNAQRL